MFLAARRDAVERIIMAPINLPPGESGGLDHTAFFEAAKPMICFNADCCVVQVAITHNVVPTEHACSLVAA